MPQRNIFSTVENEALVFRATTHEFSGTNNWISFIVALKAYAILHICTGWPEKNIPTFKSYLWYDKVTYEANLYIIFENMKDDKDAEVLFEYKLMQ